MNRPANPYRDAHRRLTTEGNEASNRGDHAEAMRLWREAGELKRRGRALVMEAMMTRASTPGPRRAR